MKHFIDTVFLQIMGYRSNRSKINLRIILLLMTGLMLSTSVYAERLKDIASIAGVRSNQLVGYGLVVGLNGTGDGSQAGFTTQGIINMLENMG